MAAWQLMMAREKAIMFCRQFVLLFVPPVLVTFCHFVWGRTFWPMNGLFLCRSFVIEWVNFLSYTEIFHMPPMPAPQLRLPLPPTPLCCAAPMAVLHCRCQWLRCTAAATNACAAAAAAVSAYTAALRCCCQCFRGCAAANPAASAAFSCCHI